MLYNYLALIFFSIFAILIPALFIFVSKLLRRRSDPNSVKNAPYESAEESIGRSRDIDNEYLPIFLIFLPFEIIVAILILWSISYGNLSNNDNILVIGVLIVSMVFALMGYRLANDKNGK